MGPVPDLRGNEAVRLQGHHRRSQRHHVVGFVSASGMEEEWYTRHNYQAYTDFKQLSGEVQALQPYLISAPQPQT